MSPAGCPAGQGLDRDQAARGAHPVPQGGGQRAAGEVLRGRAHPREGLPALLARDPLLSAGKGKKGLKR